MTEQEPKRHEAFLTIKINEGPDACLTICPEFGVWYGVQGPDMRSGAEEGLYALVRAHSRVLLERVAKGELVDGKPVDGRRIELAKRVLEVPESQIVEIFRHSQ